MKKWFRYGQGCLMKTFHHRHQVAVAVVKEVVRVLQLKILEGGFRLAEFAYNASVVGFNLTGSAIGTAIDISDYLFNNQQNETSEPSPSPPQTVNSSPPQTVNSS